MDYLNLHAIVEEMKENKAPGEDEISAELQKAGGMELIKKVYELMLEICIKEEMPAEWKIGFNYTNLQKRRV